MIEYKGYYIKPHKIYPTSYIVVTEGRGGKIPNVLDTLFTSVGYAKNQIDNYKTELERKTDGRKTRTKSGD